MSVRSQIGGAAAQWAGVPPRMHPAIFWSAAIITLSGLAWVLSLIFMAGMDQGPGTPLHSYPVFLIGWVIMLTAMMLPSEINYIKAFAGIVHDRIDASRQRHLTIAVFVAGYLIVWTAFGSIAFILDAVLRSLAIDALHWYRAGPLLAGMVLVAAGLYQLSPIKRNCLIHCRTPIVFFARNGVRERAARREWASFTPVCASAVAGR